MMNAQQLDEAYTRLCHALDAAGEARAPAVLARLALLLMQETGDLGRVLRAIDDAADGFASPPAQTQES